MKPFANRLLNLGTETAFAVSAQARAWADKGNKVYPFHLGDIKLPTPPNIIEAANKFCRDGKNVYCPAEGIPELRNALADDVGKKRGVSYSTDQVSVQPGGKPTIGKFIQTVMNPGDEVLYPNPGYPIYESQIEYQGGKAVPYHYFETDSGFDIDLEELKNSITDKTVALIYNNYQNPIGAESSQSEMEAIADIVIEHDLWMLSDDAYYEVRYGIKPKSIVAIPGMRERTVILYTFSKRFAMTGWRLGASVGPKELIENISRLNVNDESCTNHFLQWAMIEALTGDQSGPQKLLDLLQRRRDAAVEGLNAIDGTQIATPNSTFYLFPNVTSIMKRKGFTNLKDLQVQALEQSGVSFCMREHFGRPNPNEKDYFIRFAYSGISVEDIQEGLALLKNYFEQS
jgi:aspartate/methionine/tyrosine aminotransferase